MGWKTMDVQEQRVRFVVLASRQEKPFSVLCREFEISRPTGYLWVNRYGASGVSGIAEQSRRPLHSPGRTDSELEQLVIEARRRYPDWGARKLKIVLSRGGIALTRSTIHRILLRYGLVPDQDRVQPAVRRFERERPNELWQMDFKGPKNWPHRIGPLSVIDDHSRYLIVLSATGKLDGSLVQVELERAFQRCGVPESMLMDHGTPWWNWQSFSGRTHLSLWLMRQGIRLCWSGIGHPQTQGKVERFHGSLQRALDRRGPLDQEPQPWLDAYRMEYNQVRPHEALAMQTPASLWQPSPRPYNPCPPSWEYPEGAWTLKVDCQDIAGRRWRIGKTLAGERVLIQPIDRRYLVFYCATLVRELDPALQKQKLPARCKGCPETLCKPCPGT